jgi:hypothetical protein
MTPDQFLLLQTHLWDAFGPAFIWWVIVFLAAGIFLAVFVFILSFVRMWLDTR